MKMILKISKVLTPILLFLSIFSINCLDNNNNINNSNKLGDALKNTSILLNGTASVAARNDNDNVFKTEIRKYIRDCGGKISNNNIDKKDSQGSDGMITKTSNRNYNIRRNNRSRNRSNQKTDYNNPNNNDNNYNNNYEIDNNNKKSTGYVYDNRYRDRYSTGNRNRNYDDSMKDSENDNTNYRSNRNRNNRYNNNNSEYDSEEDPYTNDNNDSSYDSDDNNNNNNNNNSNKWRNQSNRNFESYNNRYNYDRQDNCDNTENGNRMYGRHYSNNQWRNFDNSRNDRRNDYGNGRGNGYDYGHYAARTFNAIFRYPRSTYRNKYDDDTLCVSQCVFGYMELLDDNRVPSESLVIKFIQDRNSENDIKRIKYLRETRRCFGRLATSDIDDGCEFSKSLAKCLDLELD